MRFLRPIYQCLSRSKRHYSIASETLPIEGLLPSKEFIKLHVRNGYLRAVLARRVSELQVFHRLAGITSPLKLDDSAWKTFLELKRPNERIDYLLEISSTEEIQPPKETKLISEVNTERHERGEMVYAPGFHAPFEIKGQDFRGKADKMYGARLLSSARCKESLPKLIVDCRFMREYSIRVQSNFIKQIQSLHDENWFSRRPFDISLANYIADSQLADLAKRYLLFKYGPQGENAQNFRPHPFIPLISSRGIKDVVSEPSDSIVYISWRAHKFLPEKAPPKTKAVVICASNDYQPFSSSLSAAASDGLTAYRLPIESNVKLDGKRRILTLPQTASILRSYFSGENIGNAIRRVYDGIKIPTKSKLAMQPNLVEEFVHYAEVLESNHRTNREKITQNPENTKPKRVERSRVHKYSREDRKRMREAASSAA